MNRYQNKDDLSRNWLLRQPQVSEDVYRQCEQAGYDAFNKAERAGVFSRFCGPDDYLIYACDTLKDSRLPKNMTEDNPIFWSAFGAFAEGVSRAGWRKFDDDGFQ